MYPSVKDIQAALVFDKYGDLRDYQTNEKLFLKLPTELSRQIEAFERRDEIKQQIQEITGPIIQQTLEKCGNKQTNPERTKCSTKTRATNGH